VAEEKRKVLVLGAGASLPYGFPSGAGLVREICGKFRAEAEVHFPGFERDQEQEVERQTKALAAKLRFSGVDSVDVFLEQNPDLQEAGKIAIASVLLPTEVTDRLFSLADQARVDPWYRHLWQWLIDHRDPVFSTPSLSIVTFNYDRSLEQFLLIASQNLFRLDETQAAGLLGQLPIVHVHGALGPLPPGKSAGDSVPYGGQRDGRNAVLGRSILQAASGIKFISDNINEEPSLLEARSLLAEADEIIFLGFGYHRTNVERLLSVLKDHPRERTLVGTTCGRTVAEVRKTESQICDMLHLRGAGGPFRDGEKYHFPGPGNETIRLVFHDRRNCDFLRHTPYLL